MDADERDAFLGDGGTGVVSLSAGRDEPPHSVPVSYGYDAAGTTFYFRLAAGPGSAKGDLDDRPVTFVTHRETDDGWRSVVASGRLESTTDEAAGTDALAGLDRVHIPYVDVFGRPPEQVAFEFYRLVPDSLNGRKEASTAV